jgi:hypothetical protein
VGKSDAEWLNGRGYYFHKGTKKFLNPVNYGIEELFKNNYNWSVLHFYESASPDECLALIVHHLYHIGAGGKVAHVILPAGGR